MRRLALLIIACVLTGSVAFAHGDFDHVRGVVTQLSPTSITVQTTGKATKTLAVSSTTKFEKSGKSAGIEDLKVGDRVVIDVPKGKNEASIITFGAPTKTVPHKG